MVAVVAVVEFAVVVVPFVMVSREKTGRSLPSFLWEKRGGGREKCRVVSSAWHSGPLALTLI